MKKKITIGLLVIGIISACLFYGYSTAWKEPKKDDSLMNDILQVDIETYLAETEVGTEKAEPILRNIDLINSFIEEYDNEDIIGYLKIDNTKINYPVTHFTDNEFYLNHDYNKVKTVAAAIYMDFEDDIHSDNYNTILYGHNMKNKTMFGDLVKYKDEEFFKTNKYIQFDTLAKSGTWEIFSCWIVHDGNDASYLQVYFNSEDEFYEFAKDLKNKSIYDTGVEIEKGDRVLTLSTCSYETNNARFVVHAKLIKE